jgi:hypothetical protein
MTKIPEIKEGMKSIVCEGFICEKSEPRTVIGRSDGQEYRVCMFLLAETKKPTPQNSIGLSLWGEDIDKFRIGDKVTVENGYVTVFKQTIQLNVGQYGKIKLGTA